MHPNHPLSINGPIGVFDSGYGGLTILDKIRKQMPEYDYIYLGDNARTPYGTRSFEVVYEFTLQAVEKLFEVKVLKVNTINVSGKTKRAWSQFHDIGLTICSYTNFDVEYCCLQFQ